MGLGFIWETPAVRVVLEAGAVDLVPDEVERLGLQRVLVVTGGSSTSRIAERIVAALGERAAAVVSGASRHMPGETAVLAASRARGVRADGVVSVGGGSATGLGTSVARACEVPLLVVATTYAGSEMTAVWGETRAGDKGARRDPRAMPRTVVYDPRACVGMPVRLAAASGMNSMAHGVEALWMPGVDPITSTLAAEGVRRLVSGLPRVVADPADVDAHAETLAGACLAGMALAQAGMGVHHRACHILSGSWDLPHAETHAILLPHAAALVEPRASAASALIAGLLGAPDAAMGLWSLLAGLPLPCALAEIGMPVAALDEAVRRVAGASARDPLVPGEAAVRRMLADALMGRRPSFATEARWLRLSEQSAGSREE